MFDMGKISSHLILVSEETKIEYNWGIAEIRIKTGHRLTFISNFV